MARRTDSAVNAFDQMERGGEDGGKSLQMDLFTLDVRDFAFKGHAASFEHPIFSMTKEPVTIEIIPSMLGLPTVYDQDILIYCISQLVAALDDEVRWGKARRRVRFTGHSLIKALGWDSSKRGYDRIKEALIRLAGAQFITTIPTGGMVERSTRLIDEWGMKPRTDERGNPILDKQGRKRLEWVEVVISEWLYRAIEAREVLTIHEGYFDLAPFEKRIYEIARKHCGRKCTAWSIKLSRLRLKSGSGAPEKKFNFRMRELCKANELPGYNLAFDGNDTITVTHKKDAKTARIKRTAGEPIGAETEASEPAAPAKPRASTAPAGKPLASIVGLDFKTLAKRRKHAMQAFDMPTEGEMRALAERFIAAGGLVLDGQKPETAIAYWRG
jgi:plasmid replication initiation protein